MSEQRCQDGRCSPLWMGVGIAAGALAGLTWMQRQRARRTSPLLRAAEVRDGKRLTALVTGASSGLGRVFAIRLAQMGYQLILVARRQERLEALAMELAEAYGVEVMVVTADLATDEGISKVEQVITATDDLGLLINNAGFGMVGTFAESDVDRHLAMVRLHVHAVIRLTRAALPTLLARRRGGIINVSSLMAYYPIYGSTSYAGTKCYLRAFTEALHQELLGSGVRVQALCPGFVKTELQLSAQIQRLNLPDVLWMSPEPVIERSLQDLDHDRVISVPGLGYRLLADVAGIVPRPLVYLIGWWFGKSRERRQAAQDGS